MNRPRLIDQEKVQADIVLILQEMTQDWGLALSRPITGKTCLVADLGFQSIDVVMLASEIHRYYQGKKFPFARLFVTKEGYVDDVTVSALVDFICEYWDGTS